MKFDTLVIGSGIAGLTAAIRAAQHGTVAMVTKANIAESNTRYAQGGIAVAWNDDDSADLHAADTIAAGAELCDVTAVTALCQDGPAAIAELLAVGVAFDMDGARLAMGREAAHGKARVIHAGGDATGFHVEAGLVAALRESNVRVFEHTALVDLFVVGQAVRGAVLLDAAGTSFMVQASATILATGGAGQMFAHTTNPSVATGDGLAAAARAGAVLGDLEFYQFHPTAAAVPTPFLISEAVRGDGAVLRNRRGERFMVDVDPRSELAPRDVVARAIAFEMGRQGGAPVYLDATAMGDELAHRFPTITRMCGDAGIVWSKELVPVTPAAHYWMGGVCTDTLGRTSLRGLYAVGEVANTGVHGANRLASNSLLEGLVFARRAVDAIVADESWEPEERSATALRVDRLHVPDRTELQHALWNDAGLLRDDSGLHIATKLLAAAPDEKLVPLRALDRIEDVEAVNLATCSALLLRAATDRKESRGAHYRLDFPISGSPTRAFYRVAS